MHKISLRLRLEIRTCKRELKVFENGKVVASGDGEVTERLFSAGRMRKLRRIIEGAPCSYFRQPQPQPATTTTIDPSPIKVLPMGPDCLGPMIISGVPPAALQMVGVTHRSKGNESGLSVYIMRDSAKASEKDFVRRNYQTFINPKWEKFFSEVMNVVGGENVLKNCRYSTDISSG